KLPVYQWQFNRVTREITEHTKGLGQDTQNRTFFDIDANINGSRQRRTFLLQDKPNTRIKPWGPLPVWGDRRPNSYAFSERLGLLALGYGDGIILCDLKKLQLPDFNPADGLNPKLTLQQANVDKSILRGFYGHEGPVTCMSFAPDGTLLLSGSKDGTICAWKISDVVD